MTIGADKVVRIPILMRRNRRRERRTAVQRDISTTKEAMGIMVSVKRIQILWLTLMCSVISKVVRIAILLYDSTTLRSKLTPLIIRFYYI